MNIPLWAWVGAGAALGSVLRAGMSLSLPYFSALPWISAHWMTFPWATLAANVAGSFAIGLFAALTLPGGCLRAGPGVRQFIMAGFCGGLTTFSIFSLESIELLLAGSPGWSVLYVCASLAGWSLAVVGGYVCGRHVNRLKD